MKDNDLYPTKKHPRKPREKIERVPLTSNSLEIINSSILKIKEKYPSIQITRKDFITWLIEDHFKELSVSNEKSLFNKFYDEVKFLEHSLEEIKIKKKNGEKISIEEILKQIKSSHYLKKDSKKQRKDKVKTEIKNDKKENIGSSETTPSTAP